MKCRLLRSFALLVLLLFPGSPASAVEVGYGDVVMADFDSAVVRYRPGSGELATISSGGLLQAPYDVAFSPDGAVIYVADCDTSELYAINPLTGAQTTVSSGGNFVGIRGIAVDRSGFIIVADPDAGGGNGAIIRVDPSTGAQTVIADGSTPGSLLREPMDVAIAGNGDIIVVDDGDTQAFILRLNSVTYAESLVTTGGNLVFPQFVDAANGFLWITDPLATGTNFGAVIRVDPSTGAQVVVSQDGNFFFMQGLATGVDGNLFVADWGDFPGDGGLIGVNSTTGVQSVLYSGGLIGTMPQGLAVYSNPEPGTIVLFGLGALGVFRHARRRKNKEGPVAEAPEPDQE